MNPKAYLLDSIISVGFWTPIVAVGSYLIGLNTSQILAVCGTSAVNNLVFGAPFGRVLNSWRKRMNYN